LFRGVVSRNDLTQDDFTHVLDIHDQFGPSWHWYYDLVTFTVVNYVELELVAEMSGDSRSDAGWFPNIDPCTRHQLWNARVSLDFRRSVYGQCFQDYVQVDSMDTAIPDLWRLEKEGDIYGFLDLNVQVETAILPQMPISMTPSG
jgi:hypothetical protein